MKTQPRVNALYIQRRMNTGKKPMMFRLSERTREYLRQLSEQGDCDMTDVVQTAIAEMYADRTQPTGKPGRGGPPKGKKETND